MADEIKVLGQLAAAATTSETLYTTPTLAQTTVSSIVVCNRTGGALTFRFSVGIDGEALGDKQYLFYDKSVPANDSFIVVIGLTLAPDDVVRTYASAVGITFTMYGVETS